MHWEKTTSRSSTKWEAFDGGLTVATILHERGQTTYWLWLANGVDGEAFSSLDAARAAAEGR